MKQEVQRSLLPGRLSTLPLPFRYLIFFLLFSFSFAAFAQTTQTVKGKITSEDGLALEAVTIQIKGTTTATATKADGSFIIDAAKGATLLISSTSFEKKEVKVNGPVLMVQLKMVVKTLEDVVVIGYGEQRRKDVNSAISSLRADDIKNLLVTGVDQMLQGKVAGVSVTQNSGAPGGGVSVKIRGISTMGGSEPLYVIDGVPIDGNTNKDAISFAGDGESSMSALSYLNPNDILSVDILKDASATSIYGNRASNGVIIITTKKGRAGDGKVSFESYYGVQRLSNRLNLLDLKGYAALKNTIADFKGDARQPEYMDIASLGSGTDWQKAIFQNGVQQNHQLALSGGKTGTTYYISGNYYNQAGIVVGSGLKRKSVRLNLDNQVKPWLKIGVNATYANTDQSITLTNNSNNGYTNVIAMAIQQSPDVPIYNVDGSFGGPSDVTGLGAVSGGNPVAQTKSWHTQLVRNKLQANVYGQTNILKDLVFRSDFGTDLNWNTSDAFQPTFAWGRSTNTLNTYKIENSKSTYWNWRNVLTYHTNIQAHEFTAMVGQEALKSVWNSVTSSRSRFPSNEIFSLSLGDPSTAAANQSVGQATQESYFGRIIYNYDNRYSFTANVRRDRTSKFAPGKQIGYFPGVAASWTLSNESFLKQNKSFNYLKLRAGYGEVGNQNVPNYTYGSALNSVFINASGFGSGLGQYVGNYANPNVTWEHQQQVNIGIEAGIGKHFDVNIDWYDKVSDRFLFAATYPSFTGTGVPNDGILHIAAPYVNFGKMENKGYDIALGYHTASGKISWKSNLVFSHYKNTVKELNSQTSNIAQVLSVNGNPTVTKTVVGQPIGLFYGYKVAGLFQSVDELNASPINEGGNINAANGTYLGDLKFADLNKDGKINGEDRTIIGDPNPKFTFGFTNNVTYKNFDLSVFVAGVYGNDIFNYTRVWGESLSGLGENQLASTNNRWTPENKNTTMPRYAFGDPNNNRAISDRFIEDGSYLRIQNVSLGYNFTSMAQSRLKTLTRLRLYASVQNLYTFTKYSGYDPEVGALNGNVFLNGVDMGRYPVPRILTVGINLEF